MRAGSGFTPLLKTVGTGGCIPLAKAVFAGSDVGSRELPYLPRPLEDGGKCLLFLYNGGSAGDVALCLLK